MIIYQIVYKVLEEGFEKVHSYRVYENYDDAYSAMLKISEDVLHSTDRAQQNLHKCNSPCS